MNIFVQIVCGVCVLAQGVYFWGRALTGQVLPWAPMGALPRYFMMMIMTYFLWNLVTCDGVKFGSGLCAVLLLVLSLAAKMYMSFAVRVPQAKPGYIALAQEAAKHENAGKAQLNRWGSPAGAPSNMVRQEGD